MFDKFCDYMYYLLTSPFKKVKKSINQWYILFKVLGQKFDDAMESLYEAAEQTMIATCNPLMLPVHAAERGMRQYIGEDDENFRKRIANYAEVCRLGGTDAGVTLAVKSLGFNSVEIALAKNYKNEPDRWAEFYVLIDVRADEQIPIGYDILRKEVRRVKKVTAKDNYQMAVWIEDSSLKYQDIFRNLMIMQNCMENAVTSKVIIKISDTKILNSDLAVEIKNNLWFLDGTYNMDGTKILDAYEIREEL